MPATSELRIGVIGAGVMGSGIAQSTAVAGYKTVCSDISNDALERARKNAEEGDYGIAGAVQRGKLTKAESLAALERLRWSQNFAEAANCDLIIECVPERLDLKLQVFQALDAEAPTSAILASNTSGFPITGLAGATQRPDRVIGWHWASPSFVMKLAEIVVTNLTSKSTRNTVVKVAKRCGKNPIVIQDSPMSWGFVSNRLFSTMYKEAERIVAEGTATREQINQIMVDCFRWPAGPYGTVKGAGSNWEK